MRIPPLRFLFRVGLLVVALPFCALAGTPAISAGLWHSLFLKLDGSVWASGLNSSGQLGDGVGINRTTPVQVMAGVAAISAGDSHSLFLKTDGSVWAAGNNYYGQLGDGSHDDRTVPVQVMTGVAAISAGHSHSLFLKTDGSVWAVGDNSHGQFGDGSTTNRAVPVQVMTGVAAISTGGEHSLFLKIDGSVWASGTNYYGQLGDGSAVNRITSVQVMTNVAAISAGYWHSLFLKTDGSVWASGLNSSGELGDGSFTNRATPVRIMTGVAAISAGDSHSLLLKTDGSVWATGINSSGALGDGSTTNRTTPIQVITGVAAISAGGAHSLFLKTDGSVCASGDNQFGQLGDGGPTLRNTPHQVMTGVAAVSAGGEHSLFLKTDGSVWASGNNSSGQLGDGSTTTRYTPVQVMTNVAAISAGYSNSLFLKTDGSVWASGYNQSGQLGDGSTTNRTTPVQVMTGVAAISASGGHSLFLKTDGSVWASGDNYYGQLGDGSTANRTTPIQVMTGVAAISARSGRSLFLKTDGSVWGSGDNHFGELGDGSVTTPAIPVQIMTGIAATSAGGGHSLFLKTNGSVWASGSNYSGELGDSSTTGHNPPAQTMTGVAAISAGHSHSLFLKIDGSACASGSNYFGQLGNGSAATANPSLFQVMTSVAAISAGYHHSLFLKTDGSVWASGDNKSGQLGDGRNYWSPIPTLLQLFTLQTIDFPALPNLVYSDSSLTVTPAATASSGLAVGFSIIAGSSIATCDSTTGLVTITGAGSVTIRATQLGNANYLSAIPVDRSFTVYGEQTIGFAPVADHAYGDAPFALVATSSSGLPVAFSVLSGPATVSGDTLTILAPGTVTVQASQAGDATYAPATATRSFTITKAPQTIDFAAIPDYVVPPASRWDSGPPPTFHLVATASSGLPVSFQIVYCPWGSISGDILSVSHPGYFTIQASQAGDAIYAPATATRSFNFYDPAPQTVDFAAPPDRTFDPADNVVTLSATASSGLPVGFFILQGPATVDGDSLHINGAGTFVIQAAQAGNTAYEFTSTTRTFTVNKASQSIAFAPLPDQGVASPAFELSATASSGLPVSFSVSGPATLGSDGKTLTLTGATGTVTVTAGQAGGANYLAGTIVRSFAVIEGTPQTIAFDPLPPRLIGAVFPLAATASSGLPVSFSIVAGPATLGADGQTVTVGSSAGTVFVRATQAGGIHDGVIYAPAAAVTRSFLVSLKPFSQTITFTRPAAITYGAEPSPLAATASSGLPVVFQLVSSVPAGIAALDGDTLAIHGAGQIIVKADQPGNDTFQPAASVTRTITINKAPLAVSFEPASRLVGRANPSPFPPLYSGFVNGDTDADLAATRPVGRTTAVLASPAGQYPITFTGGLDANYRFVAGEPAYLTVEGFGGAYEALLVDTSGTAQGKLELLVPNNALTYTGTLNLASEPAAIAIRGNLTATDGTSATATSTRVKDSVKSLSGLSLGFSLAGDILDGDLTIDSATASTLSIASGSRVFVQAVVAGKKQNAPWIGAHTLVLRDPTPISGGDLRAFPLGAGYASSTVAATGLMTLKGKLADGTALTGTARPAFLAPDSESTDGHFHIFLRPYAKRLDSFLSGELLLVPHPDQERFPLRFHVPEADGLLAWTKTALPETTKPSAQDKSYRAGFAVKVAATLDPWIPPAKATASTQAITLPERLALLTPGSGTDAPFALEFLGDFLTAAEIQALPASLTLRANGSVPPPSPNPRSFQLTVIPATGAFSGSFVLRDQISPPPAKPVERKATISGTLRQGPAGSADTLGHGHILFDPIPGDSGAHATEQISGELILSAPVPSD